MSKPLDIWNTPIYRDPREAEIEAAGERIAAVIENAPMLPDGYRLVYQGGLHDVFCDGERHIWAQGGKAGFPFRFKREGKCGCSSWARRRDE